MQPLGCRQGNSQIIRFTIVEEKQSNSQKILLNSLVSAQPEDSRLKIVWIIVIHFYAKILDAK